MTDDKTARLALPLIAPGQAQKELTHNEALAAIDIAVQPVILAVGLNTPPTGPIAGQAWIVGASPSGEWGGRAGAIAAWTSSGWRFLAVADGFSAWSLADRCMVRRVDGAWRIGAEMVASVLIGGDQVVGPRRPAIPGPQGGTTIDGEARTTLAAILSTLRAHGLIAT